jgi:hypothetical protein
MPALSSTSSCRDQTALGREQLMLQCTGTLRIPEASENASEDRRLKGTVFPHWLIGRNYAKKNIVFRDIRTQFVLHRRHITSPLQRPAG